MAQTLSIRHWQDPLTHEGVAVVFDIFRCSTTIHCLKSKQSDPLFVARSLPALAAEADPSFLKQLRVFSELRTEVFCRERYDNSPKLALEKSQSGEGALISTTTGTPAMFAAQKFRRVYVGSLVSFSALIRELAELRESITLIPAAFKDSGHVEDQIAAQAVATALSGYCDMPDFVRGCAEEACQQIRASGRVEQLSQKLVATGREDINIALDIDRFDFVPYLQFEKSYIARCL